MTPNLPPAVAETHLDLPLVAQGKVRDIYEIDDRHLLFITTDRISAFDVVLPDPIPGKGEILTRISNFWFHKSAQWIPNHLTDLDPRDFLNPRDHALLHSRSVIVKRLRPLPVEAIVRGYLIGSGWKDYRSTGRVCGIGLPAGLQLAEQLPEPIYTPSTKAAVGDHDENIDFDQTIELLGRERAEEVRRISLMLYQLAAEHARQRGIIIADTKFEFGLDEEDRLVLADEVLTPDSSRFWPADQYRVGESPVSFDKQYIRDYLEHLDWDKTPPAPRLPAEVIDRTARKYREACHLLTGETC